MSDPHGQFEPSEVQAAYVEKLAEQYETAIGQPDGVFHIVPKSIWLHKYADHVISIPPRNGRINWLYGTLLISALSDSRVELLLERPEEDTIGGVGTLARLIQYYLEYDSLDEWHTMGGFPFFGESSSVHGLLFCRPPAYLPSELHVDGKAIRLLYVAGISEEQLTAAQFEDNERGQFLLGEESLRRLGNQISRNRESSEVARAWSGVFMPLSRGAVSGPTVYGASDAAEVDLFDPRPRPATLVGGGAGNAGPA